MGTFVHVAGFFVVRAVARGLNLLAHLRDALVEARRVRLSLDAQLLRSRYRPSSKNANDLPIVR